MVERKLILVSSSIGRRFISLFLFVFFPIYSRGRFISIFLYRFILSMTSAEPSFKFICQIDSLDFIIINNLFIYSFLFLFTFMYCQSSLDCSGRILIVVRSKLVSYLIST